MPNTGKVHLYFCQSATLVLILTISVLIYPHPTLVVRVEYYLNNKRIVVVKSNDSAFKFATRYTSNVQCCAVHMPLHTETNNIIVVTIAARCCFHW